MLLTATDLLVGYGRSEVLHGISLEVDENGLAILGANGAGKTTLLRAISGMVRPRRGEICFGDRNLVGLPPERVAALGIAHVPQGRRIFANLTVAENLRLAAYLVKDQAEIRRRLDTVLELFPRLTLALGRRGHEMSGGEQQMLAIGRAMMMPASLILLDEPSDGLAPVVIEEIAPALLEVRQRLSVTLVIVEQHPWLASQIAKRSIVIADGTVVAEGETADLVREDRLQQLYLS